jgi:phage FluMu protein Com
MQEFKIANPGCGEVQYVVLKCPACGRIQRFMHRQECFGKVPKNAGCKQCQKSFPLVENSLDNDPLPVDPEEKIHALKDGRWVEQPRQKKEMGTDFTTADRL